MIGRKVTVGGGGGNHGRGDVHAVGGGNDDFVDGGSGDGGHLPSEEEQSWRQSSRSFSNEDWHKRRSFLLK